MGHRSACEISSTWSGRIAGFVWIQWCLAGGKAEGGSAHVKLKSHAFKFRTVFCWHGSHDSFVTGEQHGLISVKERSLRAVC